MKKSKWSKRKYKMCSLKWKRAPGNLMLELRLKAIRRSRWGWICIGIKGGVPLGQNLTQLTFQLVKRKGLKNFPHLKKTRNQSCNKCDPWGQGSIQTWEGHSYGFGFRVRKDTWVRSCRIFLHGYGEPLRPGNLGQGSPCMKALRETAWICESGSWIVLETSRCLGCQSHGIYAKERST